MKSCKRMKKNMKKSSQPWHPTICSVFSSKGSDCIEKSISSSLVERRYDKLCVLKFQRSFDSRRGGVGAK